VVPSDPAVKWVGPRATEEQREAAYKQLGLDQPLPVQFVRFLDDLLHGDFGYSLYTHRPVTEELLTLLPATLELVLLSTTLAILVGLPLGVLSAANKDGGVDHLARFLSVGSVSIPPFAIALFLQLVFYRWLGILPMGDRLSREFQLFGEIPEITWLGILPMGDRLSREFQLFGEIPEITHLVLIDSLITADFSLFKDALVHLILPIVALSASSVGLVARLTRSALLEILSEDYIKAAKSYGLSQRVVLWSYALKNSLGPTATVITMMITYQLTNTFLVESIFTWPGIGNYIANSIITLNYPAILGVTIISAVSAVFLNLVADLIIALDPRARK
jgi:peptide/nickel transport system permease protein